MGKRKARFTASYLITGLPLILIHPAFVDTMRSVAGVSNVQTFISSITKVVVIITGAVAVTMFAIGGFGYVTSSGNPERLERAKHTLLMVKVDHKDYEAALREPGTRPMIKHDRQIIGSVFIDGSQLADETTFQKWIDRALKHNAAAQAK